MKESDHLENRLGFIREKLDIKILILYILARLPVPVDFETLSELTLCDGGISYFDFAECAADLVDTGHAALENSRYSITEKGRQNGEATETSLPYSVRVHADNNIVRVAAKLHRLSLISASHTIRPRGGCTVSLSMSDGIGDVMSLELFTADEKQASLIEENFKKDAENICKRIMDILLEK